MGRAKPDGWNRTHLYSFGFARRARNIYIVILQEGGISRRAWITFYSGPLLASRGDAAGERGVGAVAGGVRHRDNGGGDVLSDGRSVRGCETGQ